MAIPGAWFSDMGNSLMRYGMGQYEAEQKAAQQAAALEEERASMRGVIGSLAGVSGENQAPEFLKALMLARPGTADRFGGQFAGLLAERAAGVEQRRKVAQWQLDMGNVLDAMGALPEAERPAFLAQQAARMGPEYADKLLAFSHLQQQQMGMSQAQKAQVDLENLKANNDMQLLQARTQADRDAAARSVRNAGGGGAAPSFATSPGQIVIRNQEGREEIIYPQGHPEHQKATQNVFSTNRAADRIKEFRALFEKYGTETLPTDVKGRMRNLYGEIVGDIAVSRGLGVLQAGELEMIKQAFPNPAESGAWGALGISGGTGGALDQLETEVKRNQQRNATMYRNWPGLRTEAPPPPGMRPYRPAARWAGGAPNPAGSVGR